MKKVLVFLVSFLFVSVVNAAVNVSSFEELKTAINNGDANIKITSNFSFNDSISVNNSIKIDGNNKRISRDASYTGNFISIESNGSLEINNITIDGGASGWSMDYENRYYQNDDSKSYVKVPTISIDTDIISDSSLIINAGNLTLNKVTIQNNRSTANGSILSGKGNNTIKDSLLKHSCSASNGGGLSISVGTTKISNSTFKELVAGCGVVTDVSSGAIRATGGSNLEIIDSLFEDNFAQWNGGATTTYNVDTIIKGTTFRHNMVGNDGPALELISQNKSFSMDGSLLEKNIGFAKGGQSIGTIYSGYSVNTEDTPLIFKNTIFRENEIAAGGAIADGRYAPYMYLENIEVYGNKTDIGGAIYAQAAYYDLNSFKCHDNNTDRNGGCIYGIASRITLRNSLIERNSSSGTGGGIMGYGYYEGYGANISLENTIIKNNSATRGGGIAIIDKENVFSKMIMDAESRLYDNHAEVSGDDFAYSRTGDNNSENGITLNNVSIAELSGIDGWYYDNKDDRFVDTETPTVFEDFVDFKVKSIYLKAAGINNLEYDLSGGVNDEIVGMSIRYGTIAKITDEAPVIEGKKFEGWNTKQDGSGSWFYAGDEYDGREGYVLFAQYSSVEDEKEENPVISEPQERNIINPDTRDKIFVVLIIFICSVLIMNLVNNRKV